MAMQRKFHTPSPFQEPRCGADGPATGRKAFGLEIATHARVVSSNPAESASACGGTSNRPARMASLIALRNVRSRSAVANANGRAQKYEKHLKPLVAALEGAGVDLRSGALKVRG
jgi:hypothetical protein